MLSHFTHGWLKRHQGMDFLKLRQGGKLDHPSPCQSQGMGPQSDHPSVTPTPPHGIEEQSDGSPPPPPTFHPQHERQTGHRGTTGPLITPYPPPNVRVGNNNWTTPPLAPPIPPAKKKEGPLYTHKRQSMVSQMLPHPIPTYIQTYIQT